MLSLLRLISRPFMHATATACVCCHHTIKHGGIYTEAHVGINGKIFEVVLCRPCARDLPQEAILQQLVDHTIASAVEHPDHLTAIEIALLAAAKEEVKAK
jgi:hypothetical protein